MNPPAIFSPPESVPRPGSRHEYQKLASLGSRVRVALPMSEDGDSGSEQSDEEEYDEDFDFDEDADEQAAEDVEDAEDAEDPPTDHSKRSQLVLDEPEQRTSFGPVGSTESETS